MDLVIELGGTIRCIYSEELALHEMGSLSISRGSHVEPDREGLWYADMAPVGGPRLGPFPRRSDALKAEADWLNAHWVSRQHS